MIFTFNFIITIIISICITALIISILTDFVFYNKAENVKESKKSFVATGTMFLFYFVYYMLINFKLGQIAIYNEQVEKILSILGTMMIIVGTIGNIIGRLRLKDNWANHIKIYDNHTLIKTGIYQFVRHPLYASLIFMLLGGILVYKNYLCFVVTIFVFIPFMHFRASQEEKILLKEFPDYEDYKKNTGKFFPRMKRR